MIINWYGQSCFKLTVSGGVIITTDPFDKSIGLNPPRFKADITTISHGHDDHNNIECLGQDVFAIDTPGEYEIKGVNVIGIESFHDNSEGKERGKNTIFVIEADDLRICHLGDLGQEKLTQEQIEAIGGVDILMIPIGGKFTIDGSQAAGIVNQLEPAIVVPMHFKVSGLNMDLENEERFIKEMGLENINAVDRLVLKKKDINPENTEVVLMKI